MAQPVIAEINNLVALYRERRYAEAERGVEALLKQHPDSSFSWKLLGGILQAQGKDARSAFQKVVSLTPEDPEAHYNLGVVLKNAGQPEEAVSSYRRAISLKPGYVEAQGNLGNLLKDMGRIEEAISNYRRITELRPKDAVAYYNLGNAEMEAGRREEAIVSYRRATELNPDFVEAYNNLGAVRKSMGQLEAALASYRRVLEFRPDFAEAHNNLGAALKGLGKLDAAIASFRKAIELKPGFTDAYNNLGATLQTIGQFEDAQASFRKAHELQPDKFQYVVFERLMLPVIPESIDSIIRWREKYRQGIAELKDIPGSLDEPGEKLSPVTFYLAYHNASNRPLMEALHGLFRSRVPKLTFVAPHIADWQPPSTRGERIRVGFLSEFLIDHTIGKHYEGFIRQLDRARFEVTVIHGNQSRYDDFRRRLDAMADRSISLPSGLVKQQQAVAALSLDVLFYTDIGMVTSTYFLAYARLAPIQITGWGHPDTTGLDTMDYYLSAETNEPENGDEYYTERLARLSRLPCYYYRTRDSQIPELSRSELGLPEKGVLYGCLQNLFKIHPDFDAVLAAITRDDPSGYLVMPAGRQGAWTDLLKVRWARTFPDLAERVVFLPRMPWDRFMAVMRQMDVLLDPLHFGSGNTFYDAMVFGTPVVTWPGRYARGRNVAAAYRQMGVTDAPIAHDLEEYVSLALALGRDAERRLALRSASLQAAEGNLFEDMQAVREFEFFLESAVVAAGKGERLPSGWKART